MKRIKKDAIVSQANWHPNFRIAEALPDLKVVRTDFFINAISLSLAAVAVFFLAIREYKAFSLKSEISAWEEKIEVSRAENLAYLRLSKAFKDEKAKFEEVRDFIATDLPVTEFLETLSPTIPEGLDLDSMAFGGERVVIRGTILGNSETASITLSNYLETLRKNPGLGPKFADISLTSLVRDARSEVLNFEIVLQRNEKKTST
ncbi:MAG: hypothetical protein DRP71_00740 [Verrucomicrobia bacterium]|nr:MAG: hypothetical protein DRP71_00740 [Verrucomicrobiota bacterium]